MSRVGKQPIQIPGGVEVAVNERTVKVKGPKGELTFEHHRLMKVEVDGATVKVSRPNDEKLERSLHGLTRSLIANMIEGSTKGYEKKLEVVGVGYRFAVQGSKLTASLGYSHPVEMHAPEGIKLEIDKENKNILSISGIDKQLVGEFAANVRGKRPPEPYKGKGVKYVGEHIRRKAGKTAASTSS